MRRASPKSRQVALELVLKAAATVRGWETKSGGELIGEAEIVERWIRTGSKEIPTALSPAAAGSRGKKRRLKK